MCGISLLAFGAELEVAEDRRPNDTRRRDERESVRQGDESEIHHMQGRPDGGHCQRVAYKIGLVVVPSDTDDFAPVLAGSLQLLARAHTGTENAQYIAGHNQSLISNLPLSRVMAFVQVTLIQSPEMRALAGNHAISRFLEEMPDRVINERASEEQVHARGLEGCSCPHNTEQSGVYMVV